MSTAAPQRRQGAGAPQQQENEGSFSFIFKNIRYALLIFFAVNAITGYLNKDKDTLQAANQAAAGGDSAIQTTTTGANGQTSTSFKFKPSLVNTTFVKITQPENPWSTILDEETGTERKVATLEQAIYENSKRPAAYIVPFYNTSEKFDIKVFVNDDSEFFTNIVDSNDNALFEVNNVLIDEIPSVSKHVEIELTDNVKNNGSLYLHAFIEKHGGQDGIIGYKQLQLNSYLPKKKEVKLHKLIGGENEGEEEPILKEEEEEEEEKKAITEKHIASYWHPNVTLYFSNPPGSVDTAQLPPPMADVFPLDPLDRRDDKTGLMTQYFPLIFQNKFWQLRDHMTELNSTVNKVELNLNIESSAYWKIQALVTVAYGLEQQQNQVGAITDGSELDVIKKILIETNPYLLAVTVAVTILHTLLEFLAFKSDISHWKNKKNNVGISVRSIVANVIQQIITLLYLVDNSEGTSFMILASQGIGIFVEAWKITTIIKVEIKWEQGKILPTLLITDKYELSETEAKTKEYDSIAFKYLYLVAAPLLLAYSIYSVYYKEYKSWYSFIITTLVGFVYTYGFLTLVPSVYINYRLKSVAHVPKKAMAYKVVNTFIDDLFAFVVKMPWLHRLATLRDDVIFFIYLYQTWIYRIDYTRVNEYGQGGDDEDAEGEGEESKKVEGEKKEKAKKPKESKKKK